MIEKFMNVKRNDEKGMLRGARIDSFDSHSGKFYRWTIYFNGGGIETCETIFTDKYACEMSLKARIEIEENIQSKRSD